MDLSAFLGHTFFCLLCAQNRTEQNVVVYFWYGLSLKFKVWKPKTVFCSIDKFMLCNAARKVHLCDSDGYLTLWFWHESRWLYWLCHDSLDVCFSLPLWFIDNKKVRCGCSMLRGLNWDWKVLFIFQGFGIWYWNLSLLLCYRL